MGSSRPSLSSQNWAIRDLPGLSVADQALLQAQGIQTTRQLLQFSQSENQINTLAGTLRVPPRYVKKWLALADLARVPSVGCQYPGLLIHVGILSVRQLAQTPAAKLHQQLMRLQIKMLGSTTHCPELGQVIQWVEQAKCL